MTVPLQFSLSPNEAVNMTASDEVDYTKMFRPPVNRTMRVLDRPYFKKVVPIAAAKVQDWQKISALRTRLRKETLELERIRHVENVHEAPGKISKVILLKPETRPDGMIHPDISRPSGADPADESTWSPTMSELVKNRDISIVSYDLELDYNYWDYRT